MKPRRIAADNPVVLRVHDELLTASMKPRRIAADNELE